MTQLSFSILEDLNLQRLLFLDTSDYSTAPISPTLNIKFPDFKKIHSIELQYGEINVLNTKRLGYSSSTIDFPDGVYELEFEVDNKKCSLHKFYFKATKAWKLVDEILVNADFTNKDLLEKFNKINLYLRGSEATVQFNQSQAQSLYLQAMEILKCFENVQLPKKQSCSFCS